MVGVGLLIIRVSLWGFGHLCVRSVAELRPYLCFSEVLSRSLNYRLIFQLNVILLIARALVVQMAFPSVVDTLPHFKGGVVPAWLSEYTLSFSQDFERYHTWPRLAKSWTVLRREACFFHQVDVISLNWNCFLFQIWFIDFILGHRLIVADLELYFTSLPWNNYKLLFKQHLLGVNPFKFIWTLVNLPILAPSKLSESFWLNSMLRIFHSALEVASHVLGYFVNYPWGVVLTLPLWNSINYASWILHNLSLLHPLPALDHVTANHLP